MGLFDAAPPTLALIQARVIAMATPLFVVYANGTANWLGNTFKYLIGVKQKMYTIRYILYSVHYTVGFIQLLN